MKKIFVLIGLLFAAGAWAQTSTMKQPYLLCASSMSSTGYQLILDNAAIGEATGIKLLEFKGTKWKTVAKRKIKQIDYLPAPMGYSSKKYVGSGFEVMHIQGSSSDINSVETNQADLKIDIKSKHLMLQFVCSTVE